MKGVFAVIAFAAVLGIALASDSGFGKIPTIHVPHASFDYNGYWSDWESWGRCSKTCDGGRQSRWRQCIKPTDKFLAGKYLGCVGVSSETRDCNTQGCPVDGMWSNWGSFRSCSKTCGGGIKKRDRRCNNPAPSNGGKNCAGEGWESAPCNTQGCPVDGMWSNWGSFRSCSKSCGGGIKKRDRRCNNPVPSNGGKKCEGPGWQNMACNTQQCPAMPVDGMWSDWTAFGTCTVQCGGGMKRRRRSCDNPEPSNGGKDCVGSAFDRMDCNTQPCVSDPNWSNWGPYSPCSQACGGGLKTRDRRCNNPAPAPGSEDNCVGPARQSMRCNEHHCTFNYPGYTGGW